MRSYPFVFVHDFPHRLPQGAHDVVANVIHLQELLEPGDQQSVVGALRREVLHHRLNAEERVSSADRLNTC